MCQTFELLSGYANHNNISLTSKIQQLLIINSFEGFPISINNYYPYKIVYLDILAARPYNFKYLLRYSNKVSWHLVCFGIGHFISFGYPAIIKQAIQSSSMYELSISK
jgi:hypothetical protein